MSDAAQPAGWYPDPWYPGSVRWWDGATWTEHAATATPYTGSEQTYDGLKGANTARWAGAGFLGRGVILALQGLIIPAQFARFWDDFQAMLDTPTEPHSFGAGFSGASNLFSLVTFAALIVVVVWTYRATINARALGLRTAYSPGWAVAGWIIPFANLFMPYQSVRDLFPEGHRSRRMAGWWWAFEMTAAVALIVSYGVAIVAGGGPGTAVGAGAGALALVAGVFGFQLAKDAAATHARIAAGEAPLPT